MRLTFRRQDPKAIDHEALWLGVGTALLGAGSVWLMAGLPTPGCLWHALTRHACPSCGATRSFRALLRGELAASFAWNPLACSLVLAFGLFAVYAAVVLMARLPRLRVELNGRRESLAFRWGVVALLAAHWIYLMADGR